MFDGNNKINRGVSHPKLFNTDTDNFEIGNVISVTDPQNLGRIQVRISGDNKLTNSGEELPWAFPMIPKFFQSQPKVGEAVFIIKLSNNKQFTNRVYIGPIISQPQFLNKDDYSGSALAGFSYSKVEPNININNIPQLDGVFPDPEDISIQGRFNTDITQKRNEIIIRAGKFETNTPDKFNSTTQAYIQIKNDVEITPKIGNVNAEIGTVTNIVSSKINLLTHKNGSQNFNITNNKNLISDEELALILKTARPLAFGDITLQYLLLLKEAFINHVHNGNGNKPTDLTSGNLSVNQFITKASELESQMLSVNIKIN